MHTDSRYKRHSFAAFIFQVFALIGFVAILTGCGTATGGGVAFEQSSFVDGGSQKTGGGSIDGGTDDISKTPQLPPEQGGGHDEDEVAVEKCPSSVGPQHVCVCHVTEGSPRLTINLIISKSALKAHLGNHNGDQQSADYVGQCL